MPEERTEKVRKRLTTPQPRSLAKKAEILRAAAELFLEHGYDGVSVDMIVSKVGGTKTNVYVHFGGKAELFAAVVEDLWRESVRPFGDIERLEVDQVPLEEALRRLGREFLSAICTTHEIKLHRMVLSEASKHPQLASKWFSVGPLAAYNAFTAYIARQQAAGRLVSMPAQRLAPMFIDMMSQKVHMTMLIAGGPPPSKAAINQIVDDAIEVFLHGAVRKKKRPARGALPATGPGRAGRQRAHDPERVK